MKKFLSVLGILSLSSVLLPQTARANDRVIAYPQTNPPSIQANLGPRLARLSNGTFIRDALGPSAIAGGVYSNLSVVPNGGMNLAVAPTSSTVGPGTLYQLGKLDPLPLPQSASSTSQLSADNTPIAVNSVQTVSIGGLGPIAAPATGSSIYILVEGQVQTHDTTPYLFTTFSPSGGQSTELVNSLRQDQVVYQLKSGTASATPTKPTVDTGWIPLADVLVPSGTSTITTGMITARTPFTGFAQNGLAGNFSNLKINGITTAGCLQSDSSGNVSSQTCTSGLGTVAGTSPVTATTSGGIATVGLSHGDYAGLATSQTLTGTNTFSQNVAVGGSGNTFPSLTVSNNPSSTAYSPRLYMAQNINGGARYGFDSIANQLRILYTPYGSTSENALGYFDNFGQYHVGTTTIGTNTNVGGNLTAATVASSGSVFAGASSVNTQLGITTGFSSTYPTINNSADGGLNFSLPSTDVNGYRFFKYSGTTPSLLATLDQAGNFSIASGLYAQGITSTNGIATGSSLYGPTSATVNGNGSFYGNLGVSGSAGISGQLTSGSAAISGALNIGGLSTFTNDITTYRSSAPATGALFLGTGANHYLYFDNTNYQMPNGGLAVGGNVSSSSVTTGPVSTNSVTDTGGLSVGTNATIGGALQVGPTNPSTVTNYINHGQNGTYPYFAGALSGNMHVEGGIILTVGSGVHVQGNFNQPFTTLPFCTTGISSVGGYALPGSGLLYISAYSGAAGGYTGIQLANGVNTTINVSWQCVGS